MSLFDQWGLREAWSPEARAAALLARQRHAHDHFRSAAEGLRVGDALRTRGVTIQRDPDTWFGNPQWKVGGKFGAVVHEPGDAARTALASSAASRDPSSFGGPHNHSRPSRGLRMDQANDAILRASELEPDVPFHDDTTVARHLPHHATRIVPLRPQDVWGSDPQGQYEGKASAYVREAWSPAARVAAALARKRDDGLRFTPTPEVRRVAAGIHSESPFGGHLNEIAGKAARGEPLEHHEVKHLHNLIGRGDRSHFGSADAIAASGHMYAFLNKEKSGAHQVNGRVAFGYR